MERKCNSLLITLTPEPEKPIWHEIGWEIMWWLPRVSIRGPLAHQPPDPAGQATVCLQIFKKMVLALSEGPDLPKKNLVKKCLFFKKKNPPKIKIKINKLLGRTTNEEWGSRTTKDILLGALGLRSNQLYFVGWDKVYLCA